MTEDKKNELKGLIYGILLLLFCIAIGVGAYAIEAYVKVGLFKYFFKL